MVKILKAQEVSDILQDMPKVLIKSTTRRCQEEDADRLYEQAKAQSEALIQRSKKLALSIVANARAEAQEILNEAREMSTVIFEKSKGGRLPKRVGIRGRKIGVFGGVGRVGKEQDLRTGVQRKDGNTEFGPYGNFELVHECSRKDFGLPAEQEREGVPILGFKCH